MHRPSRPHDPSEPHEPYGPYWLSEPYEPHGACEPYGLSCEPSRVPSCGLSYEPPGGFHVGPPVCPRQLEPDV